MSRVHTLWPQQQRHTLCPSTNIWQSAVQPSSYMSRAHCKDRVKNCVTQLMLYTGEKLSSTIFWCLSVCEASVSPDQISTFYNIYRHTSPLLTMYHLIASSTNLYWPSTSQYRHILTQYHQVPLIIHHLVRHSSVNWIISLFTTHLMSHAQYTWSSFSYFFHRKWWNIQSGLSEKHRYCGDCFCEG